MPVAKMLTAAAVMVAAAATAQAGSLENMERERAMLVDAMLAPELTLAERHERIAVSSARLIDLERMVIRDESLRGADTPAVRKAFDDYDLTFLVHASVENQRSVVDHWLAEIGLSTAALMKGRIGRR